MTEQKLLIVGATGDVGQGILATAVDRGWSAIAVGRDQHKLDQLGAKSDAVRTVTADVSTDSGVAAVAAQVDLAGLAAVIVTVNPGWTPASLLETDYDLTSQHLDAYLRAHLLCAASFIPAMKVGAAFIGIGGGMADAVFPGMGAVSVAQAGQRAAYRHLSREARPHQVRVRELIIQSMVAGASNRATADPAWLTDTQIGAAVCDLITETEDRRNPIVDLAPTPPANATS